MNNILIRFLTLVGLLFGGLQMAYATHLAGGDITVRQLTGSNYEITLQLYGDCDGNTFLLDNNKQMLIIPSCGLPNITANMILQNPGGTEVSQVCPSAVTRCQSATSSTPGLLRFEYKDTVSITNLACDYEFRFSEFARNDNVINLQNAGNLQFYISTEQTFSVSGANSSPVFAFNPIAYGIINQPLSLSFGATDADGDSLKYSLVDAQSITGGLGGTPSNITYESGYSATSPIQGVVLDQNTGALTATPTIQGLFTIVVKVEEFDSSGNLIGYVIRDIQVVIEPSTNLVPLAPSSFTNFSGYADSTNQTTITAYPGMDFCADITFTDGNALDTLTLQTNLNSVLPGATLNVTGQNPLTATVCWTATTGLPTNNTVVFNVSDSACTVSGAASYSLNVVVPDCNGAFGIVRTDDPSCSGFCDGTATVKMFCGSGSYTYSWSPGPIIAGQGTDSVTLCGSATPYNLVVTDQVTNQIWSTNFSLLNPPEILLFESITQDDCTPTCVGGISVSSTGGTGSIGYQWNDGSTGSTLTGLCAGAYTVSATDNEGCQLVQTYEVLEPVSVTASIFSQTDVLCNGDSTGEAVAQGTLGGCGISLSGCTSTILDTIGTGSGANTGSSFPAVYAGSASSARHQLLFTAAELTAQGIEPGPISSISFDVQSIGIIPAFDNFEIKMGCTSSDNLIGGWETGLVVVKNAAVHNVISGWNDHAFDFAYVWDGTSNIVVELCYDNLFSSVNGNTQTRFSPTTFVSVRYSTSNNPNLTTCDNNVLTGATSIARPNVRFGHCEQSLSYSWAPAPATGQATDTATGLPAGTYSVIISTVDGCADTADVTITEPTAITVSINEDAPIACNNPTGQLTASATGGNPGYSYSWNTGQNTATISALPAGTYTVTVTDNNGCTEEETYNLIAPNAVTASINQDAIIVCQGDATGQLTAVGGGGTPGYTYAWSTSQSSATIIGLSAGTYTVTVTDALGCTETAMSTLVDPPNLQVGTTILNGISCFGACDGIAEAVIIGGVAPYAVSWSNGDIGNTATSLCDGTVTVTVTDANGCVRTANATLVEPTQLTSSHTIDQQISCNNVCDGIVTVTGAGGTAPYLYSWPTGGINAQEANLCDGTYNVTVTDANGCFVEETVTLTEPAAVTASITVDQTVSCNGAADGELTAVGGGGTPGYTYEWNTGQLVANIVGLSAGTYTVTVTDASGCTATAQTTLINPSAVIASAVVVSDILCQGDANGVIAASATGGTAPYNYSWSSSQIIDTVAGLPAGTYTVTVTDINGCTGTAQTTLTDPVALTVTSNILGQISCNGTCDGSAEAIVTGGSAPYTITWSNGENGTTASALCDGVTTINVTDANGCTVATTVTLVQPAAIATSHTVDQNILCNGLCTGEATVSAAGGTLPYTYVWPTGGSAAQETGLCAGSYDVTITDAGGCSVIETVVLSEPSVIVPTITVDQVVSCGGATDGELTASATGGTPGYTYAWSNGLGTANISGLPAGTYTVTITDVNGCTVTAQETLNNPSNVIASITVLATIDCNGDATGVLAASAAGGTPGYTYSWSSGQLIDTISGLSANTYTVTVTDVNGCFGTAQTTLTEPAPMVLTDNIISQISCNGVCDGSADVTVAGGTAPYTITWSNGETGDTAIALCDGVTTINVTDANGCTESTTVTLNQPAAITTSHVIDANILCNGLCSGEATVSAAGGTAPYSYAWPTGGAIDQETGLCAGSYDVTVTDANGCQAIETVTLSQPTAIIPTITVDQTVTCGGAADGELTASATGGTPGYTYAWSNGLGTANISGLPAGTYTVTVTDANGCTVEAQESVSDPAAVNVSINTISDIICQGDLTGQIAAVATGGTPGYTYNWGGGQTNDTLFNLGAGTYAVTVSDASGCTSTTQVTLTDPPLLQVSTIILNQISCNGACDGSADANVTGGEAPYTIVWSNGENGTNAAALCDGTTTVTVTDARGCVVTSDVTLTEPTLLTSSHVIDVGIVCNGQCTGVATVSASGGTMPYSYAWPTGGTNTQEVGLCAGTYDVTVTDANGCDVIETVILSEPTAIDLGLTTIAPIVCNSVCDGIIGSNVTGGVAPYTYTWSNGSTLDTISGLCAGTYTLSVTDANGCIVEDSVILTEPPLLVATATIDQQVSCSLVGCDGQASATATGGVAPYTYAWSNGDLGASADNVCTGTLIVTVTDANGCTATSSVTLTTNSGFEASIGSITDETCFGNLDGSATVVTDIPGTDYIYAWSPAPATGQTTPTATGLGIGNYIVTVTDTVTFCVDTALAVVGGNGEITPNASITSIISCNGACDGEITANATGGTAPYTYVWNGALNGAAQTGLCAAQYALQVTDAAGCVAFDTITLVDPAPINIQGTVTDVICNGDCNGTITLIITGGTAPYNVSWDNGDVGQSILGLCTGTYVATVTDAGGCVQTAMFTVNEPPVLLPNLSSIATIQCHNDCTGEIESNPTGGVAPYTYSWNNGGSTNSLTGLCAGTYTVTVTDDVGCQQVDSITLTEPAELIPSITILNPISCNGSCDGELEAAATGGVAPYSYIWSSGQANNSITGLCDGTYTVTITDANGCDTNIQVNLAEPTDIVTTPTVTDANCGVCDGIIALSTSGGTGVPSYEWLNVVPSPGNVSTVSNLCAGSYTIVTTDGNGCTDTIVVPVNSIGGATGATFTEIIPSCNGVCDGSLTVTPVGGIAPYTYQWSTGPGDTDPTVNNLCGGSYTVTITDANGCDFIATEQLIFPFGPFTTFDTAHVSCNGNCDGSITITNTMGTGPFTYLWDDGSVNTVRTALCAGSYTVTTTDGNGCTHIDTIDITEPLALSAAITTTDASCDNTCDGSATVVVSNGTAPYSYQWSNGELNDNPIALCVGLNLVTITDANGCTLIEDVTIGGPAAIVFDNVIVDSSGCGASDGAIEIQVSGGAGGYSYAWSNSGNTNPLTGLSAGTYTVTVTDANGCTNSLAIPLSDQSGLPLVVSSQDASCNGVCDGEAYAFSPSLIGIPTYTWSTVPVTVDDTVTGLCAGQYFVTLEDLQSGCITVDSVTIGEPPVLQFASFNTVDPNCGATDGEINPVVVGGTAPYTYIINSVVSGIPFTGLGAGSYTIEVTDANGCTESAIVDLQDVGNITLTTAITDASCGNTCDGMVVVTPPGIISNYTFAWSNATSNDTLMNACAGNYTVTVTDINTGCTGVETVTVGSPPAIVIDFINVVNPNCGFADGSIEASASGGAGNFTYDWGGGLNTALISNLPVGTYTVTVTDASGCTEEASIPLSNIGAPIISASSTPASCDSSCTGTATVTVPSVGGPYTIQWSTNPGDTDPTVSNVCPGLVSVTVTDPSGCIAVDTTFITVPDGIEANLVAIDNTPCQGNCTGSITANVTSGTSPFTYVWNIPGETGASVSGLCAGTYTVTISSSDACEAILTTTIADNPPLDVQVTNVDFATCATSTDGAINIGVTGGESPYTYNWESNGFTSNLPSLSNILPGEYRLTVSDVSGCQILDTIQVDTLINLEVSVNDTVVCGSNVPVTLEAGVSTNATVISYQWFDGSNPLGTDSTQSVTIFNAGDTMFFSVQVVGDGCIALDTARVVSVALPSADAGPDTSIVRGETVMIGGSPTTDDEFATVQWTPGGSLDDSSAENPMASPDKTTVFIVEVTNSEGCISTDQMTMTVDTRFEYPDGFSPNGDGTNDTWELDFLANYLDSKVTVFNRWGTIVYESDEGYPEPWDGTMDGEDLPIGTYYYIIDLGDEGVSEPLTGPITIMR